MTNRPTRMTCAEVHHVIHKGETRRIPCRQGVAGSIVMIRLLGTLPMILSLCEVKVYGTNRKPPSIYIYMTMHIYLRKPVDSDLHINNLLKIHNVDIYNDLFVFSGQFDRLVSVLVLYNVLPNVNYR